jgi:hypothetical protein
VGSKSYKGTKIRKTKGIKAEEQIKITTRRRRKKKSNEKEEIENRISVTAIISGRK